MMDEAPEPMPKRWRTPADNLAARRRLNAVAAGADWVKMKNRKHPAMDRVMESFR